MKKSIEKLGFVVKSSDPAPAAKSSAGPALLGLSHYHQRPGLHPVPVAFANGVQCFELLTGGRGWVEEVRGEWKEVAPGDLLWHVPGEKTIGRSDFEHPYSCLAVRFRDASISRGTIPRITRWEEIDEARRFTREVVQLHADDAFDSGVLMRHIISRLQFQARLWVHRQREHRLPVELQRAMELLNRSYARPLPLQELAQAAGWSVPHLHDRFKSHLGLSPHQALIRRRIQAARELLAGTNEPIKSIASGCGFSTAAAFCAQFKKMTLLSPAEYRRRQLYEGMK
jgi:AraC-like DNA-binding protein